MAQTTDKISLSILLIGKTGQGKSATGNSILGRKAFKTSSTGDSETKFVTVTCADHGPYTIKVVDGPGLEDTDLDAVKNKEQACENMAKALMMCTGGIHAFVLVFKFGVRYTEEERRAISDLKQIFGENYLQNHGIIVMTGGDSFSAQMEAEDTPWKTFKEWCREQSNDLGTLMKECSPRVVLFNNLSKSEEEKTRQRNELLSHAGQLQKEFRSTPICRMAKTTDRTTLKILLIGKTGQGKSATGNSILGRKAFKTSSYATSETKVVTAEWADNGTYQIKVVDGPGLEDTDLDAVKDKEQADENMAKALMMCDGGVHAFVLVIKFGVRYTEEDKTTVSDLKQIFGENYLKNHGIIVMTGGDSFSDQMEEDGIPGKTFKEWCREQRNALGNLIQECSPRVVLFNNISKSEDEQTRQRNELLSHAAQLQQVQGLYTTEHFQTYAQVSGKCIKNSKHKILEETIQKRIDLLSAEHRQLSINSSLEDVDKLYAHINDVYTEIGYESLQEESMQQLIASLKRLRTTTEELRRAIREKNLSAEKEFRSTPICRMAKTTDRTALKILLIGKTGQGKSATGNSILGRKAFKTSSYATSETKVVTVAWAEHGQYEIKVVDGPGLEDTDLDAVKDKEQAGENMAKALKMCDGGVHAFVLVIKFGVRYTEKDKKTVSDYEQIFGENYLKNHGIIVMTGGDSFSDQMEEDGIPGKTFKEWSREQRTVLGNLIEECSPRIVLFNNRSKSEDEQTRQRNELLFHAAQLQQVQGLYTTEHFQTYAQVSVKCIKDSKDKILHETIQKRIDLLSAERGQMSVDSSLEDVDKLYAHIKDVYTEIGEENLQEESMQQLIASMKRLITATEELRRAIQEKNLSAEKKFRSTLISWMPQTTDKIPLNLLLIGKTGHGKSGTGNSILGRTAFKSAANRKSVTKVVTAEWAEHGPYEIKVVDGPGLGDTDLDAVKDKKLAGENMATALMMCNGGIHAFVLVIKFSTRYTEEERKIISNLEEIFGENYLRDHGIIVYTGGDSFSAQMKADGMPGKTFKEWCGEQDEDLIKECSPRVVLFNNLSESEEEQTRQRNELLFHVGQLQKLKGLYTTEHFQVYAQVRSKYIIDSKQKILEETIQKQTSLLSAELERLSIHSSLEDVDKLGARITAVYTEIGDGNLQDKSLQQLIDNLKRLNATIEELKRAIREENLKATKLNLEIMSKHQVELNETRESPWGSVAESIVAGIAAGATVVAGTAAAVVAGTAVAAVGGAGVLVAAGGAMLATAAYTTGSWLLGRAKDFLST